MSIAAVGGESATVGAVRQAAARTGVDFDYLLAQARVESGLNSDAAAVTSSARGLYQFTDATWLDTVRKHGAEHGLGWAAAALSGPVSTNLRATILDLRRNPADSAAMAAAFAQDNAAYLQGHLGREPAATDLYLAHFLGPAGAVRFLAAKDADPGSAAAAIAPAAAAANRAIFAAQDGRSRSLAEVYDRFTARLGTGNTLPRAGKIVPPAWPQTVQIAAAPQAARLAYLLLAELGA
ncbi:transglycosylase SLT domain-containing protein [Glacieibacterium sp.]|uniref:transglycosylase SLT domain-containing protein n=1 Tax=Glacieibacterium sp. TaxID=2860237 RepID=UPI003AFFFCB5